jgi:putative transposase
MARLARVIVPGLPHHVTQRGNRRMQVFFCDDDYLLYLDLLRERCHKAAVEIWAYCLMPNHVHLILTPSTPDGLARALGETHRRYCGVINARLRVTGHLFQSRFGSVVMDEAHLMAAVRYVALNPVRARLVARAQDWRWSSVRAHLGLAEADYVLTQPVLDRCDDQFADLIATAPEPHYIAALRAAETIGRPLGSEGFLDKVTRLTGREIRPAKRGPKTRLSNPTASLISDHSICS